MPLEGERNGSASSSDGTSAGDSEQAHSEAAPRAEVHERREEPIEGEEVRAREWARSATKKTKTDNQRTSRVNKDSPRAPPEPPPPILNHPERSRDDAMKSGEPSSPQTSTDAHNGPGSEVAVPGDHRSERERPASERNGRDIEVNAPRRDTRPRDEVRDDEGCRKGQSEGGSSRRDCGPSSNDGATSGTGRDSKRVEAGPLAEDEPSQHENQDQTTRSVLGLPQSPTNNHANRPTKPMNPPRRRGRLKTRSARIHRARGHAGMHPPITVASGPYRANPTRRMHQICTGDARGVSQANQDPSRRTTGAVHEDRAPPSLGNARPAVNYHIG
ncbi:hypothetical protein BU15DRAFT_83363 [Melanogaster broomeanus]|nr:hypothetical protein BU15DRAFT_83363 [Melanogaster broomeanus]